MPEVVILDLAPTRSGDSGQSPGRVKPEGLNPRFGRAVAGVLRQLLAMPEMGRPQTIGRPGLVGLRRIRVPGFANYLIFYRPTAEGIEVFRVVHGARDLRSLLREDDAP